MKLTAKFKETRVVYPLSTWEWYEERQQLIQRVPLIEEIRFRLPRFRFPFGKQYPTLTKGYAELVPSLTIGNKIVLTNDDDSATEWYVTHIEVASIEREVIFSYLLVHDLKEDIEWSVEVTIPQP